VNTSTARARALSLALLVLTLFWTLPAVAADDLDAAFEALPGAGDPARVRLVTGNHEAWYARWHAIENARQTIDCTYFSLAPDVLGQALLGLLLRKAQQGVRIRLMVDARGSIVLHHGIFFDEYLPALARCPTVQVRVYNGWSQKLARLPRSIRAAIASVHWKLLIVDGERVIAGGRNIQSRWYAEAADAPHAYHDADFLMDGAGVGSQARRAFEDEFASLATSPVKPLPDSEFEGQARHLDAVCQTVRNLMAGLVVPRPEADPSGPPAASGRPTEPAGLLPPPLVEELSAFRSMNRYASFVPFPDATSRPVALLGKHSVVNPAPNLIAESLVKLIGACREEITFAHAYMVLTERMKVALRDAGARGVKINYVTNSPESTDSVFTQAVFVKEWKTYLRDVPNLRIFALAGGRKLHGKVLILDRKVAVVGSYNMDPMSETINSEDVAITRSHTLAGEALAWIERLARDGIEYRIRVEPDGSVSQLVGPSDHCSRQAMALLALIGWLGFLRPFV
jgi:phosphatidylserine/phosphatidylglycerophosphate/cardiolipin synthase-like enzyme